jgi:hypothetical protein
MKLLISLSANVYNQNAVTNYIKRLHTGQANIDRWLDKTLRVYLLNESKYHIKVTSLPKNAPEWALKATDLVNFRPYLKLTQDLEHAIGWLRTFPDTKVFNVAVEEAIRQGELHIERENAKADSKEGIIETLHTFKDGWTIVNLKDEQALKREGKIMQHCVGTEQQNYIRKVNDKTLQIWSLRDPNNQPHCTIEYFVKTKTIEQIKGKQNLGVVQKYQPYVLEWLETAKRAKLVTKFRQTELLNLGILVQKDKWLNIYNLPDGVTITSNVTIGDDEDDEDGSSPWSRVTKLPNNLKIRGSLHIEGGMLTELPKGLQVDTIVLENCDKLTTINDATFRTLNVTGCPNLKTIGKLTGKSVEFYDTPFITTEHIEARTVSIEKSPIVEFGDTLKAEGLSLFNIPSLKMPNTVLSLKYLTLDNIDGNVTQLPNGIKTLKSLYLYSCANLILPKGISVTEKLSIKDCKSITALPKLTCSHIEIDNLKIGKLPNSIKAKLLTVTNCDIKAIPSNLECDDIRITGCELTAPSTNVTCKTLKLTGCHLTEVSIPKPLTCSKLELIKCPGAITIPEGLDLDELKISYYKESVISE